MNKVFNFMKDKAFVLILIGCIIVATMTSIWAISTVQKNLKRDLKPDTKQDGGVQDPLPQDLGGNDLWQEDAGLASGKTEKEIPMDGADTPATPKPSSSRSSGELSLSEPPEMSTELDGQITSVIPSLVPPVSGLIMAQFSANELVYNETLGDWRTHNGVDYAAQLGESVFSPIAGEILAIKTDGNWGGIVEIGDEHGNVWRFCGVGNSELTLGEAVTAGQKIGAIEEISAEMNEKPHLHLEILKDGKYQNPTDFLK